MLEHLKDGGIAQALRHKQYRRFATGDLVSLIGNWVQRVAVGWLVWKLTESGAWLGIVSMAELAPSMLLAPLGGAFADKADRRKIAIVTMIGLMGQAGILSILTLGEWIDIWTLLALTGARGCINAWSHPARQAMVPSLVPPENLPPAIALSSVFFNTARFIGPAFSGVLIARWGVGHAFLFNAATFLVFLVVLFRLEIPYAENFKRKRQSLFAQLGEGYRYVIGHAGIGPLMLLMAMSALLVRPVTDLLPGFSGAVFNAGSTGLAWLTSAMGLGSMVGAFALAQRGQVAGMTRLAVGHTMLSGAALIAFAFAPAFWIAVPVVALASFSMTITGISCQSLIQNAVKGELRGRVISIYAVIFRAGPALGALIVGSLSQAFGWHWPMALSAAICLVACLWARRRRPTMSAALEI